MIKSKSTSNFSVSLFLIGFSGWVLFCVLSWSILGSIQQLNSLFATNSTIEQQK